MNFTDPVVLMVLGVFLLALGMGVVAGLSKKSQSFFKLIGIAVIAFGIMSWSGISIFGEEQAPTQSVTGTFDVTATESLAQLTVDNEAQTITWAVSISNYSTPAFTSNSQYLQVVFSVSRGLGTVGLVQTYGDVTSVPSVTNGTTGVSTPVLTKTGDQYNAIWTRADLTTAYDMITLTIAETADGITVTLNMTASLTALSSMSHFETQNIGLSIGGEVWTVQMIAAT
jgi:hypothetical protein